MSGQKGFWDVEDRLAERSAEGDPLERLSATVDFELFRPVLVMALQRDRSVKVGRPPFCPVLKFKMLVLQSLHGLSLDRTAYMVRDRLSWMRFCGLGAGDRVLDANTLWDFREMLVKTNSLDKLFTQLDDKITQAGLSADGRTDHRCQPDCRTTATQYQGGEASDQPRPNG